MNEEGVPALLTDKPLKADAIAAGLRGLGGKGQSLGRMAIGSIPQKPTSPSASG
jgi:hypothetical protein